MCIPQAEIEEAQRAEEALALLLYQVATATRAQTFKTVLTALEQHPRAYEIVAELADPTVDLGAAS